VGGGRYNESFAIRYEKNTSQEYFPAHVKQKAAHPDSEPGWASFYQLLPSFVVDDPSFVDLSLQ